MKDPEAARLDILSHTLPNGLRVVLHRDADLPLVAVNLWYHVGSKNERPGRTGFAHLFEHMLFQGSENVGTNDHFRLVQQAGGTANGSTWYDRTAYHEVLPVHQLDLGLWLEADRMGFLLPAITQEKLDNQREVVINERRQRVDNQPYGRAFERLHELLYPDGHPYGWPVIGYVEDLEAADLEDIRQFFETFYVPNNAVLTLAGDVDYDDALRRVERFFAEIPAGSEIPRPVVEDGGARGEGRDELADSVELARLYLAFRVPPYGTPEWFAADLLATVLADGKSSILYEELVYHRQLAQDVSTFVLPTELVSSFLLVATAADGVDVLKLEQALLAILADLLRRPVAARHLERARNRLLMTHFHQFQTLERRADMLSLATTFFDDPERATAEVEGYRSVSGDAISRLLKRRFEDGRRAVVTVVPGAVEPGRASAGRAGAGDAS